MIDSGLRALQHRHLAFGWRMLFLFLLLGLGLETIHGLKLAWYLESGNETRRFLFTLAHAHGSLLALVNLAFAFTMQLRDSGELKKASFISPALMAANILLPAGFFLGGIVVYQGDPGAGILLAPIGALILIVAVALLAFERKQ